MINQDQFPEFIDITYYPELYKVFMKQFESHEKLLQDIHAELVNLNTPTKRTPRSKK